MGREKMNEADIVKEKTDGRLTDIEKAKIDILLKEYDTLRVEILQRTKSRFASLGLFSSIIAYGVFRSNPHNGLQLFFLGFIMFLVFAVWFALGYCMWRCSNRISEIENKVNQIVGQGDLLRWETNLQESCFHKVYEVWDGLVRNWKEKMIKKQRVKN